MEQNEKIVDRIKKLFALGLKAPDTPEAQSSMSKAKELMDKYNIATIDMEDDGTIKDSNVIRADLDFMDQSNTWEGVLCVHICKAFQCEVIRSIDYLTKNKKLVMFGAKTDIDFASFLLKFTRLQIQKLLEKSGYITVADKKTYCLGCVNTVGNLIKDAFVDPPKPENVTRTEAEEKTQHALIVVKSDAVVKKFEEAFPERRKGRKIKANGSRDAYMNGIADGNKVKINRQLGGGSHSKLK